MSETQEVTWEFGVRLPNGRLRFAPKGTAPWAYYQADAYRKQAVESMKQLRLAGEVKVVRRKRHVTTTVRTEDWQDAA